MGNERRPRIRRSRGRLRSRRARTRGTSGIDLLDLWPLFVCVFGSQAAGFLIASLTSLADAGIHGLLTGALMATPFGYAVGAALQYRLTPAERRASDLPVPLVLLGVVALGLGLVAWLSDRPAAVGAGERLRALVAIDPGAIRRIVIWGPLDEERLLTVDSPEAVRGFVAACRGARPDRTVRPSGGRAGGANVWGRELRLVPDPRPG